MEIEFNADIRIFTLALVVIMVLVGVLGYAVTPYEDGDVAVLTPARWKANALVQVVAHEVQTLRRDAEDLGTMLEDGHEKPVEATILAQRIYANHRDGTATTAAAREALIEAARMVALWSSGAASYKEAATAYNEALSLIEALAEHYVEQQQP